MFVVNCDHARYTFDDLRDDTLLCHLIVNGLPVRYGPEHNFMTLSATKGLLLQVAMRPYKPVRMTDLRSLDVNLYSIARWARTTCI